MPRRPRLTKAGTPHHVIQRGNNRSACFYTDEDRHVYLDWLQQYSLESGCHIHAYVLMTNHIHLLVTPDGTESLGLMMKRLGQRYTQYVNRTYRRSGTLWEGRFKSCVTGEEDYVLGCYRYIELNPVRAEMVEHPAEYRWSSYRANAQGERNPLVKPHEVYLRLAGARKQRESMYRELFHSQLDRETIDEIRAATNGSYALGTERFKREIEEALEQRAIPGRRGRPRKTGKDNVGCGTKNVV